jgi:hypothetical protein
LQEISGAILDLRERRWLAFKPPSKPPSCLKRSEEPAYVWPSGNILQIIQARQDIPKQ